MSYSGKNCVGEMSVRVLPYGRRPAPRLVDKTLSDVERKETEGEIQLKVLLNQQMDTKLTIQQQYRRHRAFHPSTTYTSITNIVSGQLSAGEFQHRASRQETIDDFRQMGLDEEEVTLMLRHDGRQEQVHTSFGADPSVLKKQFEAIQAKIDAKKEEFAKPEASRFREAKQLSRHGMELEKSIKPTSHQTQLLRNLVTTTTPEDGIHPDDPINHLKVLERELLDKVETVQHSKGKIGWSAKNEPNKDHVDEFHNSEKKLGLDVKTSQSEETLSQLTENDAPQSCSNVEKLLTREDPVVRAFVVPIPTEEVERNRMSSDEIRSTQKFASHSHGEPSNVLYLKNLAKEVSETDLIAIFARFQKDSGNPLQYRLMNGKMKGQAFVTFPDEGSAREALKFVHGFVWKGKPIIIQYGRQKGSSVKDVATSSSSLSLGS